MYSHPLYYPFKRNIFTKARRNADIKKALLVGFPLAALSLALWWFV